MRSSAGIGRGPRVGEGVIRSSPISLGVSSKRAMSRRVLMGDHGCGGPASGDVGTGFDQAAQRAGCSEFFLAFLQAFDLGEYGGFRSRG
jgi:hypothetical protein